MKLNDCLLTEEEITILHLFFEPNKTDPFAFAKLIANTQLHCKQLKRYIERIKRV